MPGHEVARCGLRQDYHHRHALLAVHISPGKNTNCRCPSAALTVGRTGGLCRHVPSRLATFGVDDAVTVRALQATVGLRPRRSPGNPGPKNQPCKGSRSHLLRSGFLEAVPRGVALALGSWLSLRPMSSGQYAHRGLSPHTFSPMLRAPPSIELTAKSRLRLLSSAVHVELWSLHWRRIRRTSPHKGDS